MKRIENKVITKLLIILIIFICTVSISTIINAKYIFQNEFYVANLDIDRTKPKIELLNITNTNSGYGNYANKDDTIKITVKISDKNIKEIFCDKEHVKVKINDKYINLENMVFTKIKDLEEEKIYEIQLQSIIDNGNLKIEFSDGTVVDKAEFKNEKLEVDTKIIIDNIVPEVVFQENSISGRKVNVVININKKIRDIEGLE